MKILKIGLFVLLSVVHVSAQAQSVERSLLSDIKQAKQSLNVTQERVASERASIARQLRSAQQSVLSLRDKTAVIRRLEDENTLGLTQLQQRIDSWRAQHNFQQNLIGRFTRQQDVTSSGQQQKLDAIMLHAIMLHANNLLSQLNPTFVAKTVVRESGVIEQAKVLKLGPLYFYTQAQQAGLLEKSANGLKVSLPLSGAMQDGLLELAQTGKGQVSFDPSNSKAIAMAQQQESAFEHIAKGGLWALPIVFFALFALVIAIVKSWQLWRLPKVKLLPSSKLAEWLSQSGQTAQMGLEGMQSALMNIARFEANIAHRDDLLFNQLQQQKYRLERWIGAIAVVASIAPLLGLLGTVSGMIETFKMMTLFGSGDPEVVSGGIAQALITTELGLVVAIPALILNALLSRRAKNYYQQLESFALQISQLGESNIKPLPTLEQEEPQRARA